MSEKTVSLVIKAQRTIQNNGNRQVTATAIKKRWMSMDFAMLQSTYLFVLIGKTAFMLV